MTVHNLSTYTFTTHELELLNKGLSYAPSTQTTPREHQLQLLKQYDEFAKTVRSIYIRLHFRKPQKVTTAPNPPQSANIYRPIKFIPKERRQYATDFYSGRTLYRTNKTKHRRRAFTDATSNMQNQ